MCIIGANLINKSLEDVSHDVVINEMIYEINLCNPFIVEFRIQR